MPGARPMLGARLFRSRRRGFAGDGRGVAATEFALVAPLLLLLYVGTVDATHGFNFYKKLDNCTTTIGDLVARLDPVNAADIRAVMNVRYSMLPVFKEKSLKIRVTNVLVETADKAVVKWSVGENTAPLAKGVAVDLPPSLRSEVGSLFVMTEMDYAYEFLGSSYGLQGPMPLRAVVYGQARSRAGMDCADCS